jgi:dTDP-4-dehydrorhamnose 3,5-epimerase
VKALACDIPGVMLVTPAVFGDNRGFFFESYRESLYAEAGIGPHFVQDNISYSGYGVLRGLHVQEPNGQGKLVQALSGAIFDVAVDVRRGSPWFGQHVAVELTSENKRQFYVPPGFAHGFCVTSETALVNYKCTTYYCREAEFSILWNDPRLGIAWPSKAPILSAKDKTALPLVALDPARLPAYVPD